MEKGKKLDTIFKLKEKNTIEAFVDESCEMAKVNVNGSCILEGNDWDFHAGCYGHEFHVFLEKKYGGWNRPEDLVRCLEQYIKDEGKQVKVVWKKYKYDR